MKHILLLLALFVVNLLSAQMNNTQMEELLSQKADSVIGIMGRWQITYNKLSMMVITDQPNDRMRIVSPIVEAKDLDREVLLDCLAANYHTALDVKYALSNGIIWSVFIHPLGSLTPAELFSAIEQVYYASQTFGNTYTSSPLLFGGANKEQKLKIGLQKM